MEINQEFTSEIVEKNYLDFDVTNYYEISSTSVLFIENLILFLFAINNFKKITIWYFN